MHFYMLEIPVFTMVKKPPGWRASPESFGDWDLCGQVEQKILTAEMIQEAEEWQKLYLDGILHGTDPDHEE